MSSNFELDYNEDINYMHSVSIVIPNYNGASILPLYLPRVIYECSLFPLCKEIILVDDASTDDSLKVIKELFNSGNAGSLSLRIVMNTSRQGFAGNANKGVREAQGDIAVLLNTDIYPKSDFLSPLIKHFDDVSVFAAGMMDLSIENGKTVKRGRGIGEWKRGFYVHRRGEVDQTDTAWVNGGSGAFRRSTFLKLGGFNPVYSPFYWEDIDLSYRAIKAGYRIIFEPKSVVVHEHDRGAILRQYTKKDIMIISYRNQFIFVWRNATLTQLITHIAWLPYHVFINLRHGNGNFFRGFWRALRMVNGI